MGKVVEYMLYFEAEKKVENTGNFDLIGVRPPWTNFSELVFNPGYHPLGKVLSLNRFSYHREVSHCQLSPRVDGFGNWGHDLVKIQNSAFLIDRGIFKF